MSYGSDSYGGAAEGVNGASFGGSKSFGGGGGGANYSLPDTNFSNQGLTAQPDTSPGYSFGDQPGYGINPGGYDISGGLGSQIPGLQGYGDYGLTPDYGLTSQFSLGQLGQTNYGFQPSGYEGMQAQVSGPAAGYGLSTPQANNGFGVREEPGFWGSKAQRAMSFLAGFNPITAGLSGLANIAMSRDPVKSGVQALLGTLGPVGQVANIGYGAATSKNPIGYLAGTAGMMGAGMVGGTVAGAVGGDIAGAAGAQLAGSAGAQLGQGLMGEALGQAARQEASIGPFGAGSPMAAGIQSAQAGGGQAGSQQGGGGRDWTDTALKVASGLYGMYQANQQKQLAQQAIGGSAPWTAQGGNAVAGQELQRVIRGDLASDPGFKLAQLAAARTSAQQPGGFAASAAANAALRYQNERIQTLGAPAGVGFNPAAGYQTALSGQQQGINTAMAGMAEIGAGATGNTSGTGMNTMPPWLQQYLINNNMRGG